MDIQTGLMIWAAQAMTLGALLFSRWLNARDQAFFLSWSLGFSLFGLGLLLTSLRSQIPDFISIQLANTVTLAAIGSLLAGMQQFDGKRVDSYVAVPALIWLGGMLLPFVREDFASRVVLYHICACIGFAILIALLLRHRDRSAWPRRILAAILTIHIATSLLTAALTALSGATSFASTPSPSLLLLPGAFCFLALVLIGAQMIAAKSEQRLMDLVLTDPLTGVLNRRGLIEEFGRLRRDSRPDKPMIALLQFDLDNFKHINDSHGHQCGDTVLIAFCRLASISLKGRGSFGRMGGEEFASILQVSDLVEAASIAEGLRMTLALQTISAGDRQVKVTVSTGISLQTAAVADLDRLLTGADRALYAAKSAGRNRTAVEQGGVASIVPSAAMLSPREMALEIHATEQVTALRHLTLVGAN